MKKLKSVLHKNKLKKIIKTPGFFIPILVLVIVLLIALPYFFYNNSFKEKIYPNIYVAGINVSGLSKADAVMLLSNEFSKPKSIHLVSDSKSFDINLDDVAVSYDFEASVERAYSVIRTGNFIYDSFGKINLLTSRKDIGLESGLDESKLSKQIDIISREVSIEPILPSIEIAKGVVNINRGSKGSTVNTKELRNLIGSEIVRENTNIINVPQVVMDPTLNDEEASAAGTLAEKFLGKSLTLKFEFSEFNYKDSDLVKFLNPKGGYDSPALDRAVYKIADSINRDPQNPKFQFDGSKVTEFAPALDGINLNADEFKTMLISNLDLIENSPDKKIVFDIPVTRTKPEVATQEVNGLGIKELIGRGTSTYFHSIPGRVFNVNLAAGRINGTLVAPGETFSFNQTLGDVSKETGYKEAYVITQGKTVLGDGGGVCQVSTTLFRAVLNAGLPVTDRTAHAYRVGYYEQNSPPGIDATVYGPRPDFKFTNDTGNHILIVAKNNPKNLSLVFELYGTSDGRTASISKPIVTNIIPALPTIYQDDATLPSGTTKQVDYAAAGSKVTFNYSVQRNGEEIFKKTFVSNYQPWAAVYLRGTKI